VKQLKSYQYERYAILCQLAYQKEHLDLEAFPDFQYVDIYDRFKKSCVRLFWRDNKKEVIIVFRGSHNVQDWLLNLCCWPVKQEKGHNGKVHWGWQKLLKQSVSLVQGEKPTKTLNEALLSILNPLVEQGKKVSCVGHSTGGCLAVLFAELFDSHHQNRIKRIVTFGQPALGTKRYIESYTLANRLYRVCCDIDLVSLMPPLPGVYRHVGKLLWLHEDKIYQSVTARERFLMTVKSWLFRPITYHFMSKYIRHKSLFDKH
jgi:predicted lipase